MEACHTRMLARSTLVRTSHSFGLQNLERGSFSVQPALAQPSIYLLDDPQNRDNAWHSWNATSLSMQWAPVNLTGDLGARVDITLWGYWEDTDDHVFQQVHFYLLQKWSMNDESDSGWCNCKTTTEYWSVCIATIVVNHGRHDSRSMETIQFWCRPCFSIGQQ